MTKIKLATLTLAVAFAQAHSNPSSSSDSSASVTCRNGDGSAVDWWVLYKQPNGVEYAYIDSTATESSTFEVIPGSDLGGQDTPPGQTLAPIFALKLDANANVSQSSDGSVSYVAYNDENPNGVTDSVKAHAKGVLGIDTTGGYQ